MVVVTRLDASARSEARRRRLLSGRWRVVSACLLVVSSLVAARTHSPGAHSCAASSQRPQPSAAQVKELYAQLTALLKGEDLGRYIDSVVDAVAVGRAYDRGYDDVA